jgi:hypothetical protein
VIPSPLNSRRVCVVCAVASGATWDAVLSVARVCSGHLFGPVPDPAEHLLAHYEADWVKPVRKWTRVTSSRPVNTTSYFGPAAGLAPPVAAAPLAAPGLASRLPPRRESGDNLAKVSP